MNESKHFCPHIVNNISVYFINVIDLVNSEKMYYCKSGHLRWYLRVFYDQTIRVGLKYTDA